MRPVERRARRNERGIASYSDELQRRHVHNGACCAGRSGPHLLGEACNGQKYQHLNALARTLQRSTAVSRVIEQTLDRLTSDGFLLRSICIVVRTNEEASEYADWLRAAGRDVLKLDRNTGDNQESPGVRVATMHRVKGLELDAVIIGGYRQPEYYANAYAEDNDAGVLVDTLTNERCLLHVAATRAKKYLLVSSVSKD